ANCVLSLDDVSLYSEGLLGILVPHCHVRQFVQPQLVVRTTPEAKREIGPVPEYLSHLATLDGAVLVSKVRHQDSKQPI
ncbi:hypothetical protein ACC756_38985, partial [Rhizobium ruizarguesonis]